MTGYKFYNPSVPKAIGFVPLVFVSLYKIHPTFNLSICFWNRIDTDAVCYYCRHDHPKLFNTYSPPSSSRHSWSREQSYRWDPFFFLVHLNSIKIGRERKSVSKKKTGQTIICSHGRVTRARIWNDENLCARRVREHRRNAIDCGA